MVGRNRAAVHFGLRSMVGLVEMVPLVGGTVDKDIVCQEMARRQHSFPIEKV